jgi:hypothetical protein
MLKQTGSLWFYTNEIKKVGFESSWNLFYPINVLAMVSMLFAPQLLLVDSLLPIFLFAID